MVMQKGFLSILLAVLYLVCIPEVCGSVLRGRARNAEGFLSNYLAGMVMMCALFQMAAVPMILMHRSLHALLWVWHGLLLIAAGALYLLRSSGKIRQSEPDVQTDPDSRITAADKGMPWADLLLSLVIAALLMVQCGFYIYGMHIDDDDARYVANAVEAYETDTMYHYHPNTGAEMTYFMGEISKEVVSPVMIFYAGISRITGIHPTVMIHTVWPVIWLCLCYIVLWKTSGVLMGKERTKRLFFLAVCMGLMIMGNTSVRQGPVFILTRLWQGKSLVPAVIAPLFFYLYLRRQRGGWRYYTDLLGTAMFACLGSGMGIFLAAFYIALIAVLHFFRERKLSILIGGGLCAVPNVCYAVIYILLWKVILK